MTIVEGQVVTDEPAAIVSREGVVGIITLNRPKSLNAVNAALSLAVGTALDELDADPDVQVIIITGAGRAFCAGADLKGIAAGESLEAPGHGDWGFGGVTQHEVGIPVIAAVNGFALGGGSEIVLSCDLAIMSEDASLGLPEVKRGLIAAAGGLIRLPRQMPARIAMEAALTGELIDAAAALRWGLVNRVVPSSEVLPEAIRLAQAIAANAPIAIRASKELIRRAADEGSTWDAELWAINTRLIDTVITSADSLEGARAFAEKRAPRWTGA